MPATSSCSRALALLASIAALGGGASAQGRDESERWVPSIALRSTFLGQSVEGDLSSSEITFDRIVRTRSGGVELVRVDRITGPLRPPASGSDMMLAALIGGSVELMTPGWQSLPGKPRLFARGDASAAFGQLRRVARESAPSSLPDPLPTTPLQTEETVDGTGSEVAAEIQPFSFAAGAGVAFTLDVFERRLRIKPSVEYMQEEIEIEGKLIRAVQTDTGGPVTALPSQFFGVELDDSTTEIFRGLGGGLELELDTMRTGPFLLSIFISGQAYKMLGDTKIELSNQTVIDNPALVPNPQTGSANWTFEKDPWSYSGAVGLRFRWLPE